MEQYKQEFINFMVESEVLKFGEFTLKSGRKSPFFMNAGAYVTGTQLRRLGEYYAKAIHDNYGLDFDVRIRNHQAGFILHRHIPKLFRIIWKNPIKQLAAACRNLPVAVGNF